jgi:hypothetical protein
MSLRDQDGGKNDGTVERSKIAVGRTPGTARQPGQPWWRITVYVGDDRSDVDDAVEEALRVDAHMLEHFK